MTPEAQRTAIAGACWHTGIKQIRTINDDGAYTVLASDQTASGWTGYDAQEIPDYLNDLNAIHDAEKVLTPVQLGFYLGTLANMFPYSGMESWSFGFARSIHATAAQRAEAFLRTIGKWDDTK